MMVHQLIRSAILYLPIICFSLSTFSVVFQVISLNPSVQWNELDSRASYYTDTYFTHTLWSHTENSSNNQYFSLKPGEEADEFKTPVRKMMYIVIALIGGKMLLLLLDIALRGSTERKFLVTTCTITGLICSGLGIGGGYTALRAASTFRYDGIEHSMTYPWGWQKYNHMRLGYYLAFYGGIISFVSSGLLLVYIGLSILFGGGKEINKKQNKIQPNNEAEMGTY